MEKMQRAYSAFEVKAIDNAKRTFKGWATTPAVDRMGDEIDPMGAKFKNPLPLLHQHRHDQVIGWVKFGTPTKKGIPFDAEIAVIDKPGPLQDRCDTAWGEIETGLVRAVSIGFRPLKYAFKEDGGIEFKEIEVLEMSSVTIPALPEAVITQVKSMAGGALPSEVIQTIKSMDSTASAASGTEGDGTARPGVSGTQKKAVAKTVSIKPQTRESKMNLQDQIKQYESLREKKVAEMDAIMAKSAETGETLSAEQEEQYDTAKAELEAIDKHLERLKTHEKSVAAKARVVEGGTVDKGSQSRAAAPAAGGGIGPTIIVKRERDEDFKGQNYTRIVIAKTLARLDGVSAVGIAQQRWGKSDPMLVEVVKAAVAGGGTDSGEWGAELAQADTRYTGDFVDFLYGATAYDKLPLRVVPANIHIKGQDGAATAYWVGQSKSIPVSKADYSDVTLPFLKVAALAVVSKELLRESSPAAEMLVRDALVKASAQRIDQTFFSASAASAGVSPAGILNGVSAISSSGTDADAVRADIKALRATFITAKNSGGLQFAMNPALADSIGLLANALGQDAFPDISETGGTLRRTPVVTGDNINPAHFIAVKPSDIWKIGDRGVEVSLSTEAAIQMDNAPDGASDTPVANASLVSMFQTESVAIKVVRPMNFQKRRASAVAYIDDAEYDNDSSP